MGKGRKPKPASLRILGGNAGHRPINHGPEYDGTMPDAPVFLRDVAKKEWERIVPILSQAKVLTAADYAALAAYCQQYARWAQAEWHLKKESPVITTSFGNVVQNPWLQVANKAQELMYKFMVEFGLTPSSRTKVKAAPVEEKDDLEDFISKRHG